MSLESIPTYSDSSPYHTPVDYEVLPGYQKALAEFLEAHGMTLDSATSLEYFVGDGAQTCVIAQDENTVYKISKPTDQIIDTVKSWNLPPTEDIDAIVQYLIRQRTAFIKTLYYYNEEHPIVPKDLLGHATLLNKDSSMLAAYLLGASVLGEDTMPLRSVAIIQQPRAKETVHEYLIHASPEEANKLYKNYTDFIQRGLYYSSCETTFKFGNNFGVMEKGKEIWGNPLLAIDAAERTGSGVDVYRFFVEQRWRRVFNGYDAPSLPEWCLPDYYTQMDTALTEDVFHALWGQKKAEDFNQPRRYGSEQNNPDAYPKRSLDILTNAFDHPAWRAFQTEALSDIEHPRAFVMELERPIDPQSEFAQSKPEFVSDTTTFAGLVAYYRQLPPNPLMDNPDKPTWYWSLQFVDEQSLHALLANQDMDLEDSWGLELQLRKDDYSAYYADFSATHASKLTRSLITSQNAGGMSSYMPKSENSRHPQLDSKMLAAFQRNGIKNWRTLNDFPYIPKMQELPF